MACSAGIRLGPGKLPALAPTPAPPGRAVAISGPRPSAVPGLRRGPAGRIRRSRLDPHRAELELGDLADRVDLVDGQQVGRGLPEVERDEAVAPGFPVRAAGLQLDRAAPRADPGQLAVGQAELGGI